MENRNSYVEEIIESRIEKYMEDSGKTIFWNESPIMYMNMPYTLVTSYESARLTLAVSKITMLELKNLKDMIIEILRNEIPKLCKKYSLSVTKAIPSDMDIISPLLWKDNNNYRARLKEFKFYDIHIFAIIAVVRFEFLLSTLINKETELLLDEKGTLRILRNTKLSDNLYADLSVDIIEEISIICSASACSEAAKYKYFLYAATKLQSFLDVSELQKEIFNKKLIASETGKAAVTEGVWKHRKQKLESLKPKIDELANKGKKHHEIAGILSKNDELCLYNTSQKIQKTLGKKEIKDFVKSYFLDTDRKYLVHGLQEK